MVRRTEEEGGMEYMRGIVARADLRDDLIDREIIAKPVQGELVANPIPVTAGLPLPTLPHAQSEPIDTEEGYTEPFIPISSPPRREEAEARA